ncbi:MAG: PDZ domain-containing protein [Lacipirellulaceae bacterium]
MTNRLLRLIALGVALLVSSPGVAKDSSPRKENVEKKVPSVEALERMVNQLDDRLYAVREKAQRELAEAGMPAVSVVDKAARADALEKSTRAVNILLQWSGGDDDELRFAALQRLSELESRPAEAKIARRILERFREQVAIKSLFESGAEIRRDPRLLVNTSFLALQVVFGPDAKTDAKILSAVAEVKAVTVVSFYSAKVAAEDLKMLDSAQQLQRIEFYGTKVSPASVARLRENLPKVAQVEVRNSAQLGIRGDITQNDGTIKFVLPGSAAEQAGLRANDVVTHVDGVEVKGFVHLTSLIAEHQAGDQAKLIVKRPNLAEPFELEVTFGRWGEKEESKSLTLQELRQRMPDDFHISNHRR